MLATTKKRCIIYSYMFVIAGVTQKMFKLDPKDSTKEEEKKAK